MNLPIIYVRGWTATRREIDATVDDPFYGLNLGSTHVRQDQTGEAHFYVFESAVVRLITEHEYSQVFAGSTQRITTRSHDPLSTLWIHRFYDRTTRTFGSEPRRSTIEEAAEDLRQLIDDIRQQVAEGIRVAEESQTSDTETQSTPRSKDPTSAPSSPAPLHPWRLLESLPSRPEGTVSATEVLSRVLKEWPTPSKKVYLVAHSMGGLVCRCLLEKIYPERKLNPHEYVDKFITFGTPHGGIHFDVAGGRYFEPCGICWPCMVQTRLADGVSTNF